MLQNIRKHATGWISGILVTLISLAFALWGVQNYLTGAKRQKVIAKVNSHKITTGDLKLQYERMKQQLSAQFGTNITINQNMQQVLKQQALQQLITREVIAQSATKSGFTISPDQLLYVIHQMPSFQFDGKFSYPRFRHIIGNMGYSEETFLEEMDRNLLVGQLRSGIETTAFSLTNEIEQAVFLAQQQRDFQYAIIETKNFEDKAKINKDLIESYYQQHLKEFETEEKVRLEYVVLSVDKIKEAISIDDNDIKNYYDINPAVSMTPKEWQIEQIIVPIALDAEQEQVEKAKALIEKADSQIKNGNEIKLVSKNIKAENKDAQFLTEKFKADPSHSNIIKYIAKLKSGEHSVPFRTEKGFHLVKIKSITEPKQKPFTDVKKQLGESLLKQKVEQAFVQQSDELSELAYTNPDSLQPIVENLKLKLHQTELFGREGLGEGIEADQKVLQVAFSQDILDQGNNSQPIEMGNGQIIVFRVKEHVPTKILPLEMVREKIIARLSKQVAEEKAGELAQSIVDAITKGDDPKSIAEKHNITWKAVPDVSRQDSDVDREIVNVAFKLPDPSVVTKKPAEAVKMANGDYAIVQLTAVKKKADHKITDQQRKAYQDALTTGYGKLEFDLYVKSLRDRAKIKVLND